MRALASKMAKVFTLCACLEISRVEIGVLGPDGRVPFGKVDGPGR